jgi:hypothetical protein
MANLFLNRPLKFQRYKKGPDTITQYLKYYHATYYIYCPKKLHSLYEKPVGNDKAFNRDDLKPAMFFIQLKSGFLSLQLRINYIANVDSRFFANDKRDQKCQE